MRKQYERRADRIAESIVGELMHDRWRVNLRKLPRSYQLDYVMLKRGKVVGFAEIKQRTTRMNEYDTYTVSLSKVHAGRMITLTTSLPCFLVVSWADAVGFVDMSKVEIKPLMWGGRNDRNDPEDKEVMVHISTEDFEYL